MFELESMPKLTVQEQIKLLSLLNKGHEPPRVDYIQVDETVIRDDIYVVKALVCSGNEYVACFSSINNAKNAVIAHEKVTDSNDKNIKEGAGYIYKIYKTESKNVCPSLMEQLDKAIPRSVYCFYHEQSDKNMIDCKYYDM